jgi:hypothetical protein
LGKRKVKKITKNLVLNGRRDSLPDPTGFCPPSCGDESTKIKWRRKSYIVVVVDDPNWRLARRAGQEIDPILVAPKTPNHCFFEAFEWTIKMPFHAPTAAFDDYYTSAVALRNHMSRNEEGDDLGNGKEEKFVFGVNVQRLKKVRGKRKFVPEFFHVPIDPDGTNLGPPLGPP